jgi:hypothetical protein
MSGLRSGGIDEQEEANEARNSRRRFDRGVLGDVLGIFPLDVGGGTMSGPNSNPEVGQQNYRTPPDFLIACLRRAGFEDFAFDLACTAADCVGAEGGFMYPELNALEEDWSFLADVGLSWLNPPFAQSGAFAKKCAESGIPILANVPVAIGTNWWRQYVHRKAVVLGVGRLVYNLPDGSPVLGKNGKPQGINRDVCVLAYNILPAGHDWYPLENFRRW